MQNPIILIQDFIETVTSYIPNPNVAEFATSFLEILILLTLVTFTLNLIKQVLHQKHFDAVLGATGFKGAFSGAIVGMLTPVCSCSVSGLYAGLISSGASRVAATAFLFAAPAVNEFAIAAMFTVAGIKGALIYAITGLTAAVLTGLFSEKLGIKTTNLKISEDHHHSHGFLNALKTTLSATKALILNLLPALAIGVLASIIIKKLLPSLETLISNLGSTWYGPVIATIVGLPMHVEAASAASVIIPIIKAGLPLGTGVSLLMATTISSVSEMTILPKVIGRTATIRLITWYFVYCSLLGIFLNQIFR